MKFFFKYFFSFIYPQQVEERNSEVSGKVTVNITRGKYTLDSVHANYSFGGLHEVFQKAFSDFKIKERETKNVLILGFGSGSVASILQNEYGKDIEITGVERDKAVIELARKYFSLEQYKNLTLINEDAYYFVFNCEKKFDLVVIDLFVDLNVPEKFTGEKFISQLGKLISETGILFFNLVIYKLKLRDKGNELFKSMNILVGKTEWCRLSAQSTENWIFVVDKAKKQE